MTEQQFKPEAERLSPSLYRVAASIVRSRCDAEDAAQEALQKAWAVRGTCRESTFPAYLMRICINEYRNVQRHRMRVQPWDMLPEAMEESALTDLQIDLKKPLHTLARRPAHAAAAEIYGGLGRPYGCARPRQLCHRRARPPAPRPQEAAPAA